MYPPTVTTAMGVILSEQTPTTPHGYAPISLFTAAFGINSYGARNKAWAMELLAAATATYESVRGGEHSPIIRDGQLYHLSFTEHTSTAPRALALALINLRGSVQLYSAAQIAAMKDAGGDVEEWNIPVPNDTQPWAIRGLVQQYGEETALHVLVKFFCSKEAQKLRIINNIQRPGYTIRILLGQADDSITNPLSMEQFRGMSKLDLFSAFWRHHQGSLFLRNIPTLDLQFSWPTTTTHSIQQTEGLVANWEDVKRHIFQEFEKAVEQYGGDMCYDLWFVVPKPKDEVETEDEETLRQYLRQKRSQAIEAGEWSDTDE